MGFQPAMWVCFEKASEREKIKLVFYLTAAVSGQRSPRSQKLLSIRSDVV